MVGGIISKVFLVLIAYGSLSTGIGLAKISEEEMSKDKKGTEALGMVFCLAFAVVLIAKVVIG